MKTLTMQAGMGLFVAGVLGCAIAAPKTATKGQTLLARATATKNSTSKARVIQTAKHPRQMTGTVEAVAAGSRSLTIAPAQHNKLGSSQTIQVPATARITMGSKPVALASLTRGEKVVVAMNGAGVVTSIRVSPGKVAKVTKIHASAKSLTKSH